MNVLVDVSSFVSSNIRGGIQRAVGEILLRLLQNTRLNVIPIVYDESSPMFYRLDKRMFQEWIPAQREPLAREAWLEAIAINQVAPPDLFFDIDAVWVRTWRRSDLYPRLKRVGVKIVSYIYDISPLTSPEAQNPATVANFLHYFGAVLNHADVILAPAQSTLGKIASLQKELGLRKIPGYATGLEVWDDVANRIADRLCSSGPQPLERLACRLRRWISREEDQSAAEAGGGGADLADQNLGSPIRFYLPCHDGISVNMDDSVWTNGQTTCLRLRMHGQFKGLCLSADLSSFNGAQPTSLFANDVPVGRFVVQGRSNWLFSIPGSSIGADKSLVLRFEFEKAISPDELMHNGDKRRLALRFFDMRFFAAEDYFLCKRGEWLSFAEDAGAQALWYCARGVSHAESQFAWTCDEVVDLHFFFTVAEGMPHAITLHYETFLPEEHVAISLGDREIAKFVAKGEEKRKIEFPADSVPAEGFVRLTLHLPDAISPKELGEGTDSRRLALKLFSIRLD